ncbi:fat-like cadherin-related tumor suppressor homolog isoform X2 [Exaiptasia diaphana]|uniref:Cadherin domain-containing protein n=1 Tax=Exaiptasia diaphana TaxID=2652724 RepID=A0A913WQP9_EXADI|nr:fat-like cadherin-related tumor suppressor homolog isoform X2 [Exaiptasia diaphana]KXJ18697.1 Cadherin EGF LAG seven-pass G-type receptor 3 [Exaiptasia diaphana]
MWLSKEVNKLKKKIVKMLSPSELVNTLLFLFCSLFLLSECSIISDPKSTIICITEPTQYNFTFALGINAGTFQAIDTASKMPQCIRESCRRKGGQVAFVIENSCFMVSCDNADQCRTVPDDSPNFLRTEITHYKSFDAAPEIQALPDTVYVSENNMPNEKVLDLFGTAISRSTFERLNPSNASVFFSIKKGNVGNAFKILQFPYSNNASLVTNTRLDRENVSYYYLTIQATNVEERKTSTKTLRVQVVDRNDNAPVFPNPNYRKTIYSNISIGTEVFRVNAIDTDTGANAQIRYYLANHKAQFNIVPETGIIVLKQKLRIDRTLAYTLIVAAINGPHRAITTVRVNVIAVNEFRPYFQRLNYRVQVSEAVEIGTSVVRISAMDSDTGLFAKIRYTIINGSKTLFEVDENGDLRNLQSLFGMGGKRFTLKVGARDGGNPPLHALQDAKIVINVIRMDRHKVKFDVPKYNIPILENIPVGSSILTVRAISGLSPENLDNSRRAQRRFGKSSKRIVYTISNKDLSSRYFRIGKHTGTIYTNRKIDYEKNKEFRLNVIAKDVQAKRRGHRIQRDNATVTIKVIDLNDNIPTFVLSLYEEIVNENTTLDSSILRVTAVDADSGLNSKIQYALLHGDDENIFTLDSNDGTLRLRKSLSGFHNKFFNLTIVATDKGKPPRTSRPVSVFLKIRRRHIGGTVLPTLTTRHEIEVNESCPVKTILATADQLLASGGNGDAWRDKSRFSYFLAEYYMSQCSERYYFDVNSRGEITLRNKLDYEKMKSCAFYYTSIDSANNKQGGIDRTIVVVKVLDVNDNRPTFRQHKYNVLYTSEPKLFSTVASVKAFDDDSGEFGRMTYWMKGNHDGYFKIDPETGVIKVAKDLQHKTLGLFHMSVSAHDHGKPPLVSRREADVNVLVFQPYSTPTILVETTDQTMTMQFNLKYVDLQNVAKFVIIVQEHAPDQDMFTEYTKLKPLTWYLVNFIRKANQNLRRYMSKEVNNSKQITEFGMFQVTIGDQNNCNSKAKARNICSGPLNPGSKYRFQLRIFLKNTGPFKEEKFKDSYFSDSFFTGPGKAAKTYRKEGRRNYDAVVYSVGAALVLVIVLAFLRGFYRLKLDRLRIHEEKKRRISFPVSNPRFQDPESPVEKIKTPGEGRKLMTSIHTEKGSEIGRSDEDEGSSPDSALADDNDNIKIDIKVFNQNEKGSETETQSMMADESTRPLQSSRQKPTLQDIRLKSYFHSVDTDSCNSCDGVRVYYMQESTA